MFTGIVEEVGRVVEVDLQHDSARLQIQAPRVGTTARISESIAVNGVCLTVAEPVSDDRTVFTADLMGETLRCTTLGRLRSGDLVNLERALRAGDRFGGHVVQGHVDTKSCVLAAHNSARFRVLRFSLPREIAKYVIPKGSIAVDGVSLTVVGAARGWFTVSLIPQTLRATTLGAFEVGRAVNLEADVLAKHVLACVEELVPKLVQSGGV